MAYRPRGTHSCGSDPSIGSRQSSASLAATSTGAGLTSQSSTILNRNASELPPSVRSSTMRKSLAFNVHQIRSYDGSAPSSTVKISPLSAIYRPKNFLTDTAGSIIKDCSKVRPKVSLRKIQITRYHISGEIEARALSLDQACYIRFSCDNWNTFQETEAINFGHNDSPEKSHQYTFDYIIPAPRDSNCPSRRNSALSDESETYSISSTTDSHGNPLQIQIMPILRSLGLLYSDDNSGEKYVLELIPHLVSLSTTSSDVGEGQELVRKSILKPGHRKSSLNEKNSVHNSNSATKTPVLKKVVKKFLKR